MEDWLHVSPTEGSGNAEIQISADENTDTEERSGKITISAEGCDPVEITVTQLGASSVLSVDTSSVSLDAAGTPQTVHVSANTDWSVE